MTSVQILCQSRIARLLLCQGATENVRKGTAIEGKAESRQRNVSGCEHPAMKC